MTARTAIVVVSTVMTCLASELSSVPGELFVTPLDADVRRSFRLRGQAVRPVLYSKADRNRRLGDGCCCRTFHHLPDHDWIAEYMARS